MAGPAESSVGSNSAVGHEVMVETVGMEVGEAVGPSVTTSTNAGVGAFVGEVDGDNVCFDEI